MKSGVFSYQKRKKWNHEDFSRKDSWSSSIVEKETNSERERVSESVCRCLGRFIFWTVKGSRWASILPLWLATSTPLLEILLWKVVIIIANVDWVLIDLRAAEIPALNSIDSRINASAQKELRQTRTSSLLYEGKQRHGNRKKYQIGSDWINGKEKNMQRTWRNRELRSEVRISAGGTSALPP